MLAEKNTAFPKIAYFCMEYGLHEDFKIYSGGLGILAGDHIKAAKDMGIPLVGIGILWNQGYTKQLIGADGRPYDRYEDHQYDFLEDTGVTVSVSIQGCTVACKVWRTEHYGNAPLYLLDTRLPGNEMAWLTDRLYYGDCFQRIAQEMILGIGGIRALRALGIEVDLYHFNEGHAVLAGFELISERMAKGFSFQESWRVTREEIVFTTHTPVAAGNEIHPLDLLHSMGAGGKLSLQQMAEIGGNPLNMTAAGLRLSRKANAVSRLHAQTACGMWENVCGDAGIVAITNGVHRGTWLDPKVQEAYEKGEGVFAAHQEIKEVLLSEIEERTGVKLRLNSLLMGFARRAATYKRSDLIFRREEAIAPLLHSGQLQLVFSGKAHPQDQGGKDIIAYIVAMTKKYPDSVVFLEDYDMKIGRFLTRGCDVWLNNPVRPLEASGTSGMKAAMNGVLNLSVLDGWWPEGCSHGANGWQFGEGYEGPGQDEKDLASLHNVICEEVIPAYYQHPDRWQAMMMESMRTSLWQFSAARMVGDYCRIMYAPAEGAAKERYARKESLAG
jgi:glycogen phosphorylase